MTADGRGRTPCRPLPRRQCLVDASGVRPTRIGSLPPQSAALHRSRLGTTGLVVRAATEDEPLRIRHAAMTDPATAAALPVKRIRQLCDDMVRAHGDRSQPFPRAALDTWAGARRPTGSRRRRTATRGPSRRTGVPGAGRSRCGTSRRVSRTSWRGRPGCGRDTAGTGGHGCRSPRRTRGRCRCTAGRPADGAVRTADDRALAGIPRCLGVS
ncbi:hypothetical protein GCM10010240_10220 [Streptomyces griseoviridis]|nr:hypothetical protein GCM10010240_10220 [Streptomyces griseoviridis]